MSGSNGDGIRVKNPSVVVYDIADGGVTLSKAKLLPPFNSSGIPAGLAKTWI